MAATTPPFFHALAVFACKSNRLYRVFVCPNELVFIWAGKGYEGMAGARKLGESGPPSLIRSAIAGGLAAALDPSKKNASRAEVLNNTPLENLINDDERNMRAPISGFTEVRIGKRSDRHARSYSDHTHQALLYLRHDQLGKSLMGIPTIEDVQLALKELPRVLGGKFRAEVELPLKTQPCGCVFCRR